MLSRLTAAVVGLLAFAGCILVGLAAGNPAATILQRALLGLVGGMLVGHTVGCLAQVVVNEQFRAMVAADMETEMTAAAQPPAPRQPEYAEAPAQSVAAASTATTDRVGKDGTQESRDALNAPVERATLAARAASELFPDT